MTDDDLETQIRKLHEHLTATQELPVERTASRWIGEAEAVTADIVDADVSPAVIRERIGHVQQLLANVDETDQSAADNHVDQAKRLVADILERLDDR